MKSDLLLIGLVVVVPVRAQSPVQYEIAFPNADHHEAEVSVTFTELPPQVLEVRMSRTSPGRYALHEFAKNVYNVRAVDGQGRSLRVSRPNPHQWNVAGHDGTVTLSYTVFGDRCDGTYLAIDNTHAHLNMPATFMWARGLEDRPVQITFHKPSGDWHIATQLVPTESPETYAAPDLAYFMDSPTELSAFEFREWSINTDGTMKRVQLALHHQGTPEEVDAYARMCQAVVAEAVAVFEKAPPFDYGSYIFIADYLPYVNGDGMEHRNSTILTSTRSLSEHAVRNLNTVAHEFFHAWNVERMRPRSLEPFDLEHANMSGELWFAEGFTSYYDGLLLKRAGLLSLDRFAEDLGRTLNRVLNAPGRRYFSVVEMSQLAPFVDAATSVDPRNFQNTYVSYYPYGAAIALGLDLTLRLRHDGRTLDEFMRAVWQEHGTVERPYTNEDLRRILGTLTEDVAFADAFFRRYIYGREVLDYRDLLEQVGFRLQKAHPGKAWIGPLHGFVFEDGQARLGTVALVGSPLYEAGVDRNDVIVSLDGQAFATLQELEDLLSGYRPGEAVEIVFNKRGVERRAELVFQEDPTLEVVPYERLGLEIRPEQEELRSGWLGKKSAFTHPELKKYCPVDGARFDFEFEHCPYHGERLRITPPR